MHKAPTVDYPVGRSRFQMLALLVIGLGVTATDVFWFWQAEVVDWRQWLGLAVTLAAAIAALQTWRVSPSGTLHWDGRSWWWEVGGVRIGGVVGVFVDLQGVLLLCFRTDAGVRQWLWLEQIAARTRWSALRRAVHAPAVTESDAGQTAFPVEPAQQGDVAKP